LIILYEKVVVGSRRSRKGKSPEGFLNIKK